MKRPSAEKILGISAVIISLMTLFMFVHQTNMMQKQNRLSVTPRIGFSRSFDQSDSTILYSIIIKNKGIGPGIINSFKVIDNEKEYELGMEDFFEKVYPELKKYGVFKEFSQLEDGSTLVANEAVTLFTFQFQLDKMDKIQAYLNIVEEDEWPFNLEIEYSSMYEEKWRVDILKGSSPMKIK